MKILKQKKIAEKKKKKIIMLRCTPTADELKAEDFEGKANVYILIKNAEGNVFSNVSVKNKKGFQRAAWGCPPKFHRKMESIREAFRLFLMANILPN